MELHSTSPKHNLSVHHSPYCSIGFLSTLSKFPALKFRVPISSVEHHFFYQYFTISSTYYTLILSSLESIDPDLSVLSVPLYFLNNFDGSSPDYLQLHLSSNTRSSWQWSSTSLITVLEIGRFEFIIQSMPVYTTWEKNMRCLSQQLTVAKCPCP